MLHSVLRIASKFLFLNGLFSLLNLIHTADAFTLLSRSSLAEAVASSMILACLLRHFALIKDDVSVGAASKVDSLFDAHRDEAFPCIEGGFDCASTCQNAAINDRLSGILQCVGNSSTQARVLQLLIVIKDSIEYW